MQWGVLFGYDHQHRPGCSAPTRRSIFSGSTAPPTAKDGGTRQLAGRAGVETTMRCRAEVTVWIARPYGSRPSSEYWPCAPPLRGNHGSPDLTVVIFRPGPDQLEIPASAFRAAKIASGGHDTARIGVHDTGRAYRFVLVADASGRSRDLRRCAVRHQPAPRRRGARRDCRSAGLCSRLFC